MSNSNHLTRLEIKKTLKEGKRFSIERLQAIFLLNSVVSGLAVIVPKKSVSGSVERNIIRRRFKEAFRLLLKDEKEMKFGLVLICHSPNYSFKKCVYLLKEIINFIAKKKNGYTN